MDAMSLQIYESTLSHSSISKATPFCSVAGLPWSHFIVVISSCKEGEKKKVRRSEKRGEWVCSIRQFFHPCLLDLRIPILEWLRVWALMWALINPHLFVASGYVLHVSRTSLTGLLQGHLNIIISIFGNLGRAMCDEGRARGLVSGYVPQQGNVNRQALGVSLDGIQSPSQYADRRPHWEGSTTPMGPCLSSATFIQTHVGGRGSIFFPSRGSP